LVSPRRPPPTDLCRYPSFTVVLVRGGDAWQATTFHNSLVVS